MNVNTCHVFIIGNTTILYAHVHGRQQKWITDLLQPLKIFQHGLPGRHGQLFQLGGGFAKLSGLIFPTHVNNLPWLTKLWDWTMGWKKL